jgi:PAS domain S-box-containing protein
LSGRAKKPDGEGEARLEAPARSSVLAALTQAPLGIAIFDREMRYLAASSRYLTDQGLPGDTPLVGRLHYDVFPGVPQHWRDIHARALEEGAELSEDADPYLAPSGRTEWIRWSLKPWRTDGGEIGGLVLYTEVVTPSVEARLSLEAAEGRYRAVFDQVAMGVARVAPDGRFLEANDRFCAIAGYGRDELLALTFQAITHPDDLDSDIAQATALLAGEVDTFAMEKRYITKAGETVWVNLTVSLVRAETGGPDYFVSIIEDIGYRKEIEAEQARYQDQLRLLINELNHRVKNTLATVQSMAVQTLRGERDLGVAYGKFEARLLGLSQVHDLLTRERWYGAGLQDVAERALQPFFSGSAERVCLRGPEVWLQPGPALTMALVFHELATNAVKYGALSSDRGRVDLSWTFDEADERLSLTWAESGGPPVAPPTRVGFGSRLIQRGLQGDLRGFATLRYDPGGLICAMEARLPKAAATKPISS